jgi:hypothetical protein
MVAPIVEDESRATAEWASLGALMITRSNGSNSNRTKVSLVNLFGLCFCCGELLQERGIATLRQPSGDLANVVETPALLRPQRDVPLLTRHEKVDTVPYKNL